jgi:nitrogen fixation protein NifU and related proteins
MRNDHMEEAELKELFQSILQDHARRPRHVGKASTPGARTGRAVNPACGDEVEVTVAESGIVLFTGAGCAVSQASASLLAVKLQGKSAAEMAQIRGEFAAVLRGESEGAELGELGLFRFLRPFPARLVCAGVAWQALAEALAD